MIKNTVIALVAAASLAGVAAPAYAESIFGDSSSETRAFTQDNVVAQLRANGVNVASVEEWSGLVRAYVTLEDGTQAMQFYTPGTLTQVTF